MDAILRWLSDNLALVSALTSLLMVLVWLFYANLFYRDFRSRHHPRILIHQAPDDEIDSMCFVVNMSQQLINVVGVFATAPGTGRAIELTEYRHYTPEDLGERELKSILKQGPLGSGEFLHLGTFNEILGALGDNDTEGGSEGVESVEVRVALYHGPSDLPVGARREFRIVRQGAQRHIRPQSLQTLQMTSRRERKRVGRWLEQDTT